MSAHFLCDPPPDTARPHKAVNVPRSSVLAYQERPRNARAAAMVAALMDAPDRPTSAELARWMADEDGIRLTTEHLLSVRRGLSDALKLGLVEHAGERKCAVSGRQCVLWRVRTR